MRGGASAGADRTRVGEDDEPVSGRPAVCERQVTARAVVAEKLLALAEDYRMEPEQVLVDEVMLDQRLHQLGAAQSNDRLSGLLFQNGDFLRNVTDHRRPCP